MNVEREQEMEPKIIDQAMEYNGWKEMIKQEIESIEKN